MCAAKPTRPQDTATKTALAWTFAASAAALALLPSTNESVFRSLAALVTAAACAALLAGLSLLPGARRPVPMAVWLLGMPALVLALRGLTVAPLSYSLVGLRTNPHGAAVWVIAWAWLALFAVAPSGAVARKVTATIALMGGVAGAVALWQKVTGALDARSIAGWSSEATGVFTSSNALGQYALLAIGCGIAWYAVGRSTVSRVGAAAATALSVCGLALSISRGSWAAAFIGAGVAWLAMRPKKPLAAAATLSAATLAGGVALFAAAAGVFGSGLVSQLDSLLSGRATIWHRALLQWSHAVLVGEGPARFSAYTIWSASPQMLDGIDAYGTFDPHSVPLVFAVAGGAVALVALLGAVGYAVFAVARNTERGARLGQAALIGAVSAWAFVQVIEMSEVAPLVTAAALAGLLLGQTAPAEKPASPLLGYAAPLTALVLALAMLVPTVSAFNNALAYRRLEKAGTADTAAALDYWTRTGDPSYATDHLGPLLGAAIDGTQPGLTQQAQMLAGSLEPANRWFVDAARMSALAWTLPTATAPTGSADKVRDAIGAGHLADPGGNAMWDAVEKNDIAIMRAWRP